MNRTASTVVGLHEPTEVEGDELSGEEPGYVPPDHKTTAEFRVPGRAAGPGAAAADPEATAVDASAEAPFDSGATLQDIPKDDAEEPATQGDLDVTLQDAPSGEPPSTVTDGMTGAPDPSVTATDIPAPFVRRDPPEAVVFAAPGREPDEQGAEPGDDPEAAGEQTPVAAERTAADPQPAAPSAGPWTGQFSAEAEPAAPASAHGTPGAPPQEAPSQETTPPAFMPSGGAPPSATSRSRRPVLLVALAAGTVVLLAAAGVAILLLTGRSGGDGAAAKTSPSASAPAGEGGGAAPAPTGGDPQGGAPPAPPAGRPSAEPPGQAPAPPPAPPPVPTAPIGPVMEGDGITYQLVQQDEGYFEGRMVITNRTGRPMRTWKITFRTPGADVKNIWGGKLVEGGERAVIENLDGAPAIPPGGTWAVQFGASGATTAPKGCKLNGEACGF